MHVKQIKKKKQADKNVLVDPTLNLHQPIMKKREKSKKKETVENNAKITDGDD